MPESQSNKARKRNLLRRVRRQRLKYITILPSLITLLNGIFGFAAIGFAGKGFDKFSFFQQELSGFAVSGYLIFIAMIADMLDGRVARMSHTTSSFGGQLDSLCDMISFGVAPAYLAMKVLEVNLTATVSSAAPLISEFVDRFIWLTAAVYIACAAIRLARFNVENEEDETAHMSFVGLPTPAAAGTIASIIVFCEEMLPELGTTTTTYHVVQTAIMIMLPFIAIGISVLMIGRIRYPHLINQYFKGKKPFATFIWSICTLSFVFLCKLPNALLIAFCGFALTGFVKWLYYKVIMKKRYQKIEPAVLPVTTNNTWDD